MTDICHIRLRRAKPALACLGCAIAVLVPAALAAPAARAELNGLGPDESIQQANAQPALAPGTVYSGAFSTPQDIDYLAIDVPQPETVRLDIANTLRSCPPFAFPGETLPERESGCAMWGTLIEGAGQQLGGEGSRAGTGPVEYASYEEIEWAFTTAGRYYLVLENDYYGEMPTFQVSYNVLPASSSTGTGTGSGSSGGAGTGMGTSGATKSQPGGSQSPGGAVGSGSSSVILASLFEPSSSHSLISSATLAPRQHGRRVAVRVVLAQRLASVELGLVARLGPRRRLTLLGHITRKHPIAGSVLLTVPVRLRMLRAGSCQPLTLRIRAEGLDGSVQIVQRHVLLRR